MATTPRSSTDSNRYTYLFVTTNLVVLLFFFVLNSSSSREIDEFRIRYHELVRTWLQLRVDALEAEHFSPDETQRAGIRARVDEFTLVLSRATSSESFIVLARLGTELGQPFVDLDQPWAEARQHLLSMAEGSSGLEEAAKALDRVQQQLDGLRLGVDAIADQQERAFDVLLYCLGATILVTVVVFLFAELEVSRKLRDAQLIRLLARATIQAQEDERSRIARGLHDSLAQELTLVSIEHNLLLEDSDDDTPEREDLKYKAEQRISRAIAWVRELAHELRPGLVDYNELGGAVCSCCAERSTHFDGEMECNVDNIDDSLTGPKAVNVYRIVQKAVSNAVRHSGATRIVVALSRHDHEFDLVVSDNGNGFRIGGHREPSNGIGIANMRERAELVGGSLHIDSKHGRGTVVRLVLQSGDS